MPPITRRDFIASSALTLVAATALPRIALAARPFVQPPLPFAETALAPLISAQTIQLHYGKHHAAYYAALNRLTDNTAYSALSLEEVIVKAAAAPDGQALFNAAGQAWNHDFYWQVLTPGGANRPTGRLAQLIDRDFGGFQKFAETYARQATGIFGSGWAWLVQDGDRLSLVETSNADTPLAHGPLAHGRRPLATIDVWEHAYYLDVQNRRADHVKGLIETAINWDFVGAQLA